MNNRLLSGLVAALIVAVVAGLWIDNVPKTITRSDLPFPSASVFSVPATATSTSPDVPSTVADVLATDEPTPTNTEMVNLVNPGKSILWRCYVDEKTLQMYMLLDTDNGAMILYNDQGKYISSGWLNIRPMTEGTQKGQPLFYSRFTQGKDTVNVRFVMGQNEDADKIFLGMTVQEANKNTSNWLTLVCN